MVLPDNSQASAMKITTKGQVTIPRRIREILGLTPETDIDFIEDSGRVYIVKTGNPQSTQTIKILRGIATAQLSTDEIMSLTREQP